MVRFDSRWSEAKALAVLVGWTVSWISHETCWAQDSPKTAIEECSIFEVAYLNAASIRSADVLVQREYHLDTVRSQGAGQEPRGVLVDTSEEARFVFDFDKQTFCVIEKKGPNTKLDMGDPAPQPAELTSEFNGWALNYLKKELYFAGHDGPVPWRLTREKTLFEFLKERRFRDPRVTFGEPNIYLLEERLSGMRKLASGKNFWKKEVVDDRRLKLTFFEGLYEDGDSMVTWTFDLTNSLPIACEVQDWHAERKVFYPGGKQSFEWQAVDGYDVIKEIRLEMSEGVRSVTGEDFYGHSETTVKFTWLSVNQEHSPKFFDGTLLESPATLRASLEEAKGLKQKRETKPAK